MISGLALPAYVMRRKYGDCRVWHVPFGWRLPLISFHYYNDGTGTNAGAGSRSVYICISDS